MQQQLCQELDYFINGPYFYFKEILLKKIPNPVCLILRTMQYGCYLLMMVFKMVCNNAVAVGVVFRFFFVLD